MLKPRNRNSRIRIITTAAILLLTLSAFISTASFTFAHTPAWTIPTYAYVALSPERLGVGESALVVVWLDKYPPTAEGTGGDLWRGFTLDITKPDGSKETIGPIEPSSQVGSAYVVYRPTQVGDYIFVFSWPGQTLANGTNPEPRGIPFVGDYYQPSKSAPVTLHVQQTPVQGWTEPPLPTGFWTTPINAANRQWSTLATNWPGGSWFRQSNFQEYGQTPNTAHVLWQEPLTAAYPGGIVDARWPGQPVDVNDYESPWSTPIILNGKIYYNTPQTAESSKYGYYCMDLYTGQQIWYKNGTDNGLNNPTGLTNTPPIAQSYPRLSFGQLYHYLSLNGQGVVAYLWITVGSTWYMIDAATGNMILTLKNVPGGTAVTDQDGSLLRYSYNAGTGKFLAWNSSQAIPPMGPLGTDQQQWKPPNGLVIDAVNDSSWYNYGLAKPSDANRVWSMNDILPRSGYTMNVTGPKGLPPLNSVLRDKDNVPQIMFFQDMRNSPPRGDEGSSDMFFQAAAVQINYHAAPYSPFPDATYTQNNNLGYGVTLLWNKTIPRPLGGNLTWIMGPISYDDKVFTVWAKETMQWWGYSLDNGQLLWGPTDPQQAWDMYDNGGFVAYGKLFSGGYSGVLTAYDIKTGTKLWNYTAANVGYESPYGNYPISLGGITDGKIYLYSTEHSPTKPLWRGSYLRCINATDGKEIWKLLDFNMGMGIAEGYIVTASQYDNMIYCIGKGPSATTVLTQNFAAPQDTPVMITGSVTDQSPGKTIWGAPAAGTPAISDSDMSRWMEYLYGQQIKPTDAKGVSVHLTAIDPNSNFQDIGNVMTDMTGNYAVSWTPPVPGLYKITATFAGSNSYGESSAQTSLLVAPKSASPIVTPTPTSSATQPPITPVSPTPIQTPVSPSPTQAPPPAAADMTTIYVAISAAIVVVIVATTAVILRKRK